MALEVVVTCSYHQKKDGTDLGRQTEIVIDSIDDANRKHVQDVLERRGWVVQFNGEHMDTYCSKECAK